MKTLQKIENYMCRENAHGFTACSTTRIMDVIIYITGFCDVKIYESDKLIKSFQIHRDTIIEELYKCFKNTDIIQSITLFG